MNDYLIYLCLPPYLAQWYAHECNQVHNRDKATCPREIYRFPTPVVPVRGSQESVAFLLYLPTVYRVQCPNSIWTEWTEKGITGMACRRMDDEEEGMRGKWGFTSKKCEKSPKYAIK